MDWNEAMQQMKNSFSPEIREEKLRETIRKSQEAYLGQEKQRHLNWQEFLWSQFCYTRKRWWALQASLLLLAWVYLPIANDTVYRVRSVGVIGCLFVILMIPELWRNKASDSTQVEAACLYSLRQVYAARIMLFGMVDVVLLSLFSAVLGSIGFSLIDVLAQLLLPVTVTACICFSMLCGKRNWSESVSLSVCLIWSGFWWLILMNDNVYFRIVPAVWVALFGVALTFLILVVRKTINTANQYWEVDFA